MFFKNQPLFFQIKIYCSCDVINAMASNQKTTTIKTLRIWKKEFQMKIDFDINTEYKVCHIQCFDCKKWEPRIKEMKNFSDKWIKGTENVAKDVVQKHAKGEPHLQAVGLSKWSELCIEVYQDSVSINLPLVKGFLRLNPADKDSLWAKFSTTYYALKKERSFADYPDLLNLQTKNGISKLGVSYSTLGASAYCADYSGKVMCEDLKKANFESKLLFSIVWWQDWSAVIEQEMVLFICVGTPVLKYLKMSRMLMHLALNQPWRSHSITLVLLTITTNE